MGRFLAGCLLPGCCLSCVLLAFSIQAYRLGLCRFLTHCLQLRQLLPNGCLSCVLLTFGFQPHRLRPRRVLSRQLLSGCCLSCALLLFGLQSCRLGPCHFLTRGFLTRGLLLRGFRARPFLGDLLPRRLVDAGRRCPASIRWCCRDGRR